MPLESNEIWYLGYKAVRLQHKTNSKAVKNGLKVKSRVWKHQEAELIKMQNDEISVELRKERQTKTIWTYIFNLAAVNYKLMPTVQRSPFKKRQPGGTPLSCRCWCCSNCSLAGWLRNCGSVELPDCRTVPLSHCPTVPLSVCLLNCW